MCLSVGSLCQQSAYVRRSQCVDFQAFTTLSDSCCCPPVSPGPSIIYFIFKTCRVYREPNCGFNLYLLWLFFCLFAWERVLLCSSIYTWTLCIDQADLKYICLCLLNARIKDVSLYAWLTAIILVWTCVCVCTYMYACVYTCIHICKLHVIYIYRSYINIVLYIHSFIHIYIYCGLSLFFHGLLFLHFLFLISLDEWKLWI